LRAAPGRITGSRLRQGSPRLAKGLGERIQRRDGGNEADDLDVLRIRQPIVEALLQPPLGQAAGVHGDPVGDLDHDLGQLAQRPVRVRHSVGR
jgi:hypothetical protein